MTRLELENNHSLKRIVAALERIADMLAVNNALSVREISPGYFGAKEVAAIREAVQKEVDSLVQNKGEKE